MSLPIFSKNKPLTPTLYLALLISDTQVRAALWQASSSGLELLETSPAQIFQEEEQLVVEADRALQELSARSNSVDEVILGLASNWTNQDGILPGKKPVLKRVTEKLSLKAVGFVVTAEALVKQLAYENQRLSCLFVEFGHDYLSVNYVSQGKLLISKQVGRSAQTLADMTEALARVNAHYEAQNESQQLHYPPKILLASAELSEEELSQQQQLLIEHDWVNTHPFQHRPTVDLVECKKFMQAVVLQGGQSVVRAADQTQVGAKSAEKKEESAAKKAVKKSVDQPVKTKPAQIKPVQTKEESSSVSENTGRSFGIPLKLEKPPVPKPVEEKKQKAVSKKRHDQVKPKKKKLARQQGLVKGLVMRIKNWFKKHRLFAMVGFVAGLLTLAVGGYWWLGLNTQAILSLKLNTKAVSQETELTLDATQDSSDPDQLILAAKTVSQEVSASKSKESAGSKKVGEKAVGTVIIYNKTKAEKTFEAGTNLSKGNLSYSLDEEVKVASASVETSASGENKEYGQAEAKITATAIGAEANLEKEVELQVASYDLGTYAAMVKDGLSGGSSREVKVVSVKDQEEVLADLKESLLEEAEQKMKQALQEKERLVKTNDYEIVTQEYSAEVGDEVNTFDLNLTLLVKALSYHEKDLVPLAEEVLAADVPAGYSLLKSKPQILSDTVQDATQSGSVKLQVNLSAMAEPKLELSVLQQELVSKSLSEATRLLEAKAEIKQAQIRLEPRLAETIRPRLPQEPEKISFE